MVEEKVSIIVTIYRVEQYLNQCMKSIIAQTYKNIEIVLVDDGSPDNCPALCDEWAKKDRRVKVVHKKNEGLAAARKTGVMNAIGDYVGFVDADDTIKADMFEFLLANALKYDADISHCGYTMIRPKGERIDYYGTGKLVVQDHAKGLIDLIEGKYIEPTTCTKLYKRSLFQKIEYYTDVSINEDLMLNYSLFSVSQKSVYQDVCKYFYYKHDDSMSRTMSSIQFTDPVKVKQIIYEKSKIESAEVQAAAKTSLVSQYIRNCFDIKTNGYKEYRQIYSENRKRMKGMYRTCKLSVNDRFKANIIVYTPCFCGIADRIYKTFKS